MMPRRWYWHPVPRVLANLLVRVALGIAAGWLVWTIADAIGAGAAAGVR